MSTIGMMEGAFFVGRKEIMDWINSTLDLNLAKVEDTASGAVACQLLDIMYPGQVPMSKVNWAAKQDFEFIANYKILQTCFTKLNIDRFIDVDRLISGKYMDNLEFMQWFKRFFEMNVSNKGDYDAVAQRSKGKGGAQFGGAGAKKPVARHVAPSTTRTGSASAAVPAPAPRTTTVTHSVAAHPPAAPTSTSTSHRAHNQENTVPNQSTTTATVVEKASSAELLRMQSEIDSLRHQLEDSQRSHDELKQDFEGLEKERDFYFEKLRDVEILMQEMEDKGEANDVSNAVLKILYATADGFEQVVDESGAGNVSAIPATPHKSSAAHHMDVVEGQETF